MNDTIEWRKHVPVIDETDVLVVGAGISGAAAAVTAAREGAGTLVVDRFGYPGGNMGPGMVSGAPDMELPDSMKGGMPGVPGEFIHRCEEQCHAPLLAHYFRDSQVVSYVWTRMMREAGVRFLFNTYAGDPVMDGNRITGLFVENKNGTGAIRSEVVVDATGDADVAARAGAPVDEGKGYFSPGVYFAMANVDINRYVNKVYNRKPGPEDVEWVCGVDSRFKGRLKHIGPLLPYYRAAWEAGEYRFVQEIDGVGKVYCDHGIFRGVSGVQYVKDPLRLGRYGILGALAGVWREENPTSGDSAVMIRLETGTRTFIYETVRFLSGRVPGFEKAYLLMIAPYFNSRGGRSIVSERPVTVEDVDQGSRFDDVVFQAYRRSIPPGKADAAVEHGQPYDFPFRQLLPKGVEGLLVTGRACIIQPPSMRARWMVLMMGEAAGAAAAQAVRTGRPPRNIDVRELQRTLHRKYGMPMGDEDRLRELDITG